MTLYRGNIFLLSSSEHPPSVASGEKKGHRQLCPCFDAKVLGQRQEQLTQTLSLCA